MHIRFIFSNGLIFRYLLNESSVANSWLEMMKKVHPRQMARMSENHRHGFASSAEIKANINRLAEACKIMDMPEPDLSTNNWQNWQQKLNAIHLLFPEKVMGGVNSQVAHTVNLLIHWLEYELANLFDQAGQYLFNLDFNHQPDIYRQSQKIPFSELDHFTTDLSFGDLNLHYIYIGRHFLEMANAQDFICLKEHFRPQWHFNPTCALNFSEAIQQNRLEKKMQDFYRARGGREFFGFDYHDPRMAKGFFKLGQLENLSEYSLARREEIRTSLANAQISHWEFD